MQYESAFLSIFFRFFDIICEIVKRTINVRKMQGVLYLKRLLPLSPSAQWKRASALWFLQLSSQNGTRKPNLQAPKQNAEFAAQTTQDKMQSIEGIHPL